MLLLGFRQKQLYDTTAMVTLLSEKSKHKHEQVVLKGLAEVPVHGKIVPNMNIRLGNRNYKWNLCVAPMSDNIILGIDFLQALRRTCGLWSKCGCNRWANPTR